MLNVIMTIMIVKIIGEKLSRPIKNFELRDIIIRFVKDKTIQGFGYNKKK